MKKGPTGTGAFSKYILLTPNEYPRHQSPRKRVIISRALCSTSSVLVVPTSSIFTLDRVKQPDIHSTLFTSWVNIIANLSYRTQKPLDFYFDVDHSESADVNILSNQPGSADFSHHYHDD